MMIIIAIPLYKQHQTTKIKINSSAALLLQTSLVVKKIEGSEELDNHIIIKQITKTTWKKMKSCKIIKLIRTI